MLKVTEPAADLAALMALVSTAKNIPLPHNMIFFGEVGLSRELRQVTQYENRLNEVMKLKMQTAVMPYEHKKIACNLYRIWLKHITDIHNIHKLLILTLTILTITLTIYRGSV